MNCWPCAVPAGLMERRRCRDRIIVDVDKPQFA
jgi:hypothetical protein